MPHEVLPAPSGDMHVQCERDLNLIEGHIHQFFPRSVVTFHAALCMTAMKLLQPEFVARARAVDCNPRQQETCSERTWNIMAFFRGRFAIGRKESDVSLAIAPARNVS